jgi:Uncharacterized conserved protein
MKLTEILNQIDGLKAELSTLQPLPAEALQKIQDAIRIEYTYDSNRIEGNTLTLQETALVVNEGITISGKSMREHLEAVNHAEAVDFIREIATDTPITESVIRDIHGLVLRGIDKENAGRYRTVPVMISGSKFLPPQPYLIVPQMEAFMNEYQRLEPEGVHPVIIAAYLHDELVKIHPFIDGNGRTSRLLMNLYLLRHGFPIVSLKSDNDSKLRYYNALEKSHTEGKRDDFYLFVAETVKDALGQYLSLLRG